MNIGIISMHRVRNYGSFLQGYGLKKMLEQQGHCVKFIDIESAPRAEGKSPAGGLLHRLRRVDRYVLKRLRFRQKKQEMSQRLEHAQREYLGLEASFSTAEGCDAVVIGSDEIFNCDSKGPWKITSERFGDVAGVKKVISYAASCGYTRLEDVSEGDISRIEKGIGRLDSVSVRDENTAKFVSRFREGEVLRHLDPVLMYDFDAELSAAERCGLPEKPYMVVYAYHNRIHSPSEIKAIRGYAKKHGLRTIAVGGAQCWCDEYAVLSPFEVLAYFKHAACVVTDTFHGTVISAKYQKPFAVLVRDSNANKLEDLLVRLGLEAHALREPNRLEQILSCETDYADCREILAAERLRATAYLQDALSIEG